MPGTNSLAKVDIGHVDREVCDVVARAEAAEVAAAEAEALAVAARARVRAIKLRRQIEATEAATREVGEGTGDDDAAESQADGDSQLAGAPVKARRFRRPERVTVLAGIAVLCTGALLAVSVLMVVQRRNAMDEQQRAAEFSAAARRVVVTLMSIDAAKAKETVRQIVDISTGPFRDEFQRGAEDFVKVAQGAKVSTAVTVQAAAVESMTDRTAVVLVAARSILTNAAGAQEQPHSWRVILNLARDGGQIKMSSMEFVA